MDEKTFVKQDEQTADVKSEKANEKKTCPVRRLPIKQYENITGIV